jgi:hypothetical protein
LKLGHYPLVTHRDVFASEEARTEPSWSLWLSLAVLVGGTAVIAIEAELVSDALTKTADQLGLSPLFLSVIVLALIGTAADLFAAVYFAHKDRMGLVMSIGSAIQIALGHGAAAGSDFLAARPSDGSRLHKPARSLCDRRNRMDRQRDCRRRRDDLVRGRAADRGLRPARARVLLFCRQNSVCFGPHRASAQQAQRKPQDGSAALFPASA